MKRLTHGNTRILLTIMPNLKGHTDSIKDSQFKAAWQSGPTRTIRVPIALAEITLEYARQLDQGVEPRDTSLEVDVDVDASISEPRDTRTNSNSQASNLDESVATEPRDTAKLHAELEDARADYAKLLESSTVVTKKLEREVQELRSQLATERADREEIEAELEDLKQNSAPARKLDKAHLLNSFNQFIRDNKKSNLTFAQMKALLGMIEKS